MIILNSDILEISIPLTPKLPGWRQGPTGISGYHILYCFYCTLFMLMEASSGWSVVKISQN